MEFQTDQPWAFRNTVCWIAYNKRIWNPIAWSRSVPMRYTPIESVVHSSVFTKWLPIFALINHRERQMDYIGRLKKIPIWSYNINSRYTPQEFLSYILMVNFDMNHIFGDKPITCFPISKIDWSMRLANCTEATMWTMYYTRRTLKIR